jgi:hypothetical protein
MGRRRIDPDQVFWDLALKRVTPEQRRATELTMARVRRAQRESFAIRFGYLEVNPVRCPRAECAAPLRVCTGDPRGPAQRAARPWFECAACGRIYEAMEEGKGTQPLVEVRLGGDRTKDGGR